MQLVVAGYRNIICADVFVHHHGMKSTLSGKLNKDTYSDLVEKMSVIFRRKWHLKNPTISACLIVKNEEHCLETCLKSIAPHVDEIIVVDTGSTDKTIEVAKKFKKVKVFNFEWIEDFAAARNFANEQATGDFILSVDADEVFTGLEGIKNGMLPVSTYRIETRNYTTNNQYSNLHFNDGEYPEHEKGVGWFPSNKIRLFPRRKEIRWEYPVHEVVEESCYYLGLHVHECKEVVVHHWSRVDDTKYMGDRSEKYFELLKKNAANGKRDLRCLEQLAIQAQGMKKYDEAEGFWMEVLALDPMGGLVPLNMCHISAERGDWNLAKEWAIKAYMLNPDNKDVNQNMALCYFNTGDYLMAERLARGLLKKEPVNPLGKALLKAIIEMKRQKS
jgi:tetratricopeptide (TPR) repeat protein